MNALAYCTVKMARDCGIFSIARVSASLLVLIATTLFASAVQAQVILNVSDYSSNTVFRFGP